jgi:hypothetical protein
MGIEIDSDGVQQVRAFIERIETELGSPQFISVRL